MSEDVRLTAVQREHRFAILDLAGDLVCTGLEYTRFLTMQLRQGLDGGNRLLSTNSIQQQRADAFGPAATIAYSAYTFLEKAYHYGFGDWPETANGQAPSASNPVNRWSSTGKFGWAPWVASNSSCAGLIMALQPDAPTSFVPSENLKAVLDPLIRSVVIESSRCSFGTVARGWWSRANPSRTRRTGPAGE